MERLDVLLAAMARTDPQVREILTVGNTKPELVRAADKCYVGRGVATPTEIKRALQQGDAITQVVLVRKGGRQPETVHVFDFLEIRSVEVKKVLRNTVERLYIGPGVSRDDLLALIQEAGYVATGKGFGKIDLLVTVTAPSMGLTDILVVISASVAQLKSA